MEGVLKWRFCVIQLQIVLAVTVMPLLVSGLAPDPTDACQTATLESESARFFNESAVTDRCDSGLVTGWYRFSLNDRPAEITTRCIKNNHCGTQLPLHVELGNSNLPDTNQTIMAHVCGSYNVLGKWDCCVLRKPVYIKNCTTFYAYHLQPTDRCPVAYCLQVKGEYPYPNMTIKTGEAVQETNNELVAFAASDQLQTTRQATTPTLIETTTSAHTATASQTTESSGTTTTLNVPSTTSIAAEVSTSSSATSGLSLLQSPTSAVDQTVNSTSTFSVSTTTEAHTTSAANGTDTTTQSNDTDPSTTQTASASASISGQTSNGTTDSSVKDTTTQRSANITNTTAIGQLSTHDSNVSMATTTLANNNDSVSNGTNTSIAMTTESSSPVSTSSSARNNSTSSAVTDAAIEDSTEACDPSTTPSFMCGNNTCFRLPNGSVAIVCMVNRTRKECVVACDNFPNCQNGEDELPILTFCGTTVCSEGQTTCPNKTGCHNNCNDQDVTMGNLYSFEFSINCTQYSGYQAKLRNSSLEVDVHRAVVDTLNNITDTGNWYEDQITITNTSVIEDAVLRVVVIINASMTGVSHNQLQLSFQNDTVLDLIAKRLFQVKPGDEVSSTISGAAAITTGSSSPRLHFNATNRPSTPVTIKADPSPEISTSPTSTTINGSMITPDISTPTVGTTASQQTASTSTTIGSGLPVTSVVMHNVSTAEHRDATISQNSTTTIASETSPILLDSTTGHSESHVTTPGMAPTDAVSNTSTTVVTIRNTSQPLATNQSHTTSPPGHGTTSETTMPEIQTSTAPNTTISVAKETTIVPNRTLSPTASITHEIQTSPANNTTTNATTTVKHHTTPTLNTSISSNTSGTHEIQTTTAPNTTIPSTHSITSEPSASPSKNTMVMPTTTSNSSTTVSISRTIETLPTTVLQTTKAVPRTSFRTTAHAGSTSMYFTSTVTPTIPTTASSDPSVSTVSGRQSSSASNIETTAVISSPASKVTTTKSTLSSPVPTESSSGSSPDSATTNLPLTTSSSHSPASDQDHVSSTQAIKHIDSTTIDTTDVDGYTQDSLNTVETPIDGDVDDDHEIVKLFKQNTGLFIFLIIAGTAMLGICLFGIGGTIYQKRMRTWSPEIDDTYPDMEKSMISIGRERTGIESPIPDIDILQGEETGEGESPSKASTLVCAPTPDRVQGTSCPRSYDTPLNGHANEAFHSDESLDLDGVIPYEELDERPPRNKFPWIENAEDTKV